MSGNRWSVRASGSFFDDLDDQFPSERGSNGEPSAHDFLLVELFRIIEVFATAFDQLVVVDDDPTYRMLITSGRLVPFIVVTGWLTGDGAIELISLDVDSGE